ncbi:YbdD/YjiX family protein [Nocardia sp. NPDC049149]|uniref:YbdD/YjiX family protein n=1 Tax=Nocardia sp. NPDC049149 TaxID=3364315 RepID=UPI00371D9B5B
MTIEVASAPAVETAAAPTNDTPVPTVYNPAPPTIDTSSVPTIDNAAPGTTDTIPIPTIDTAEMGMIDLEPAIEGAVSQDDRSARPVARGRLRRASSAGVTALRKVGWWFNSILGGQDYRRYVDHLARNHPGCEIPTEREYWRTRHADADNNPTNRCC